MAFPTNIFATFNDLMNYINTYIIPNGLQEIDGDEHNSVENGLLTFIRQSPLNWQTARIESTGGTLSAIRPVTVFMSSVPTSFSWGDNIYNQYIFINTTGGDIATTTTYYDINLTATNIIPAKSIVNVSKASNGLWIVSSVPSSGSQASAPPYVGIVDGGSPNDPVSGTGIFQNDSLIGLGSTNGGKIQIVYADQLRSNYGVLKSFDYDNIAGIIDLTFNGGEQFFTGYGLQVDRNQ